MKETNVHNGGTHPQRDWLTALLFSFFLGWCGVDRFYMGYIGLGIAKVITAGGCGVWWLIDLILIAMGGLRDVDGQPLKNREGAQ